MNTNAKIEKNLIKEQEYEENYEKLVRMTNELMKIHSCSRSTIAVAAGIHPNNLSHYYNKSKNVTKKTLRRLQQLYDQPITNDDKVKILLDENEEIKAELAKTKEIALQAIDMAIKADKKVYETNRLLETIELLMEKLKR